MLYIKDILVFLSKNCKKHLFQKNETINFKPIHKNLKL